MGRLRLTLLGGFQGRLDSGQILTLPTRKAQGLLAYLALPLGQTHPRDKLAALLWGGTPETQARRSLRQALFALRKALGGSEPASLRVDGDSVGLNPATVAVDVADFERLVEEGTPEALGRAGALYQGDFLSGFPLREPPFEEWLVTERERLRELALEALAKLLGHLREAGALGDAVQTAVKLLALDPLQEPVHRALMRLYVQVGRRGAALRQYQLCVSALQRELGIEPEARTKELYREILREPRSPGAEAALASVADRAPGPFPGVPHDRLSREVPLVGREPELARLREALETAAAGRGRVLAVVGEAGIGKTRLLAEAAAEAAGRGRRVLLGRAWETEQILPFGPWVDALRAGRVLEGGNFPESVGPAWRAELARLLPELGPARRPGADEGDHLRLFESVAVLVAGLGRRRPLVVLLEDLHWADEMSLRLLAFLGRRLSEWPVLIVVTAREEELVDAPLLRRTLEDLSREEYLVRLDLGPLSQPDTITLVQRLARPGRAETDVARLGEQVWLTSAGHPLTAVETVRALQEAPGPRMATDLPLPQRVRELLSRRLERLSEPSRQLATVAAVIGREFEFPLLPHAAGVGESEAAERVEELVRRRILHGVGERFDFTHDRIREVVLGQLLPLRRKLLHRRVGEAMEALYAGNLDPHHLALGTHYRAGEVWDRAVVHLRRAGAMAGARWAHREAAAGLEAALATLGHLPRRRETVEQAAEIRLELGRSLYWLGELRRGLECVREAEALARTIDDRRLSTRASTQMARYLWATGEPDLAMEAARRALAGAEELGDVELAARARLTLGVAHHDLGDYRRAMDFLHPSATAVEAGLGPEVTPRIFTITSLRWRCWGHVELGEFEEGRALVEEAVRIAEAVDEPWARLHAQLAAGLLFLRRGEVEPALVALERGLELCRLRNNPLEFCMIASPLGSALTLAGRLDEGLPLLEEAVDRAAAAGLMHGQPGRLIWLSEAYLLRGRIDEAIRLVGEALDLARVCRLRGHEARALRLLGEIAARREPLDLEEAREGYSQALALAGALGMRPVVGHCHLGLGALYRRAGQRERARAELGTAIELFRAMGMAFWLARAEAELALAA